MSLPALNRVVFTGSKGSQSRTWVFLLTLVLLVGATVLSSCTSKSNQDAKEALEVVQDYLTAIQSGDIELARGYWTDINNPGGSWTLVARRDMEHVTRDHSLTFADGWEIVNYDFQAIEGLPQAISVLKLDVRVQPSGLLKKLEVGLVKTEERWYIYSIYPGSW